MSSALSHTAPQLQVDQQNIISMPCCKGYSSSKASHGVEDGMWYFEVEILKGSSVRVGWAQALADIQAPVGYDEYGYGLSINQKKIFHCSRGYPVESKSSEKDIKVIGCLLKISETLETFENDSNCELVTEIIKKYPPLNFLTTYNVKQSILKSGTIQFYADGKELSGARFENIYRAKYFPTVSCFGDSTVKVTFKAEEFKFTLPEGAVAYENVKEYSEPMCKNNNPIK